jgi:ADP-ribose pyrophosphatase
MSIRRPRRGRGADSVASLPTPPPQVSPSVGNALPLSAILKAGKEDREAVAKSANRFGPLVTHEVPVGARGARGTHASTYRDIHHRVTPQFPSIAPPFTPTPEDATPLAKFTIGASNTDVLFASSDELGIIAELTTIAKSPPHTQARAQGLNYAQMTPPIHRDVVVDSRVSWLVGDPSYKPTEFTARLVLENSRTNQTGHKWADPNDPMDRDTQARLHDASQTYQAHWMLVRPARLSGAVVPLNMHGRTGIVGRGILGKWGANHAADPLVTRWIKVGGVTNLQVVLVKRKEGGQWAMPGGMVDAGEAVSVAAAREFSEEAGKNVYPPESEEFKKWQAVSNSLFHGGRPDDRIVYKGYVDDPRNTDNAWMETIVYSFHIASVSDGALFSKLGAGDDAASAAWVTIATRKRNGLLDHTPLSNLEREFLTEKSDTPYMWADHTKFLHACLRMQDASVAQGKTQFLPIKS